MFASVYYTNDTCTVYSVKLDVEKKIYVTEVDDVLLITGFDRREGAYEVDPETGAAVTAHLVKEGFLQEKKKDWKDFGRSIMNHLKAFWKD